mgnify:CR=1 FL=1
MNTHKNYFKEKLKGIQCMIWDLEFKRYKTFYVREQIRKEYDAIRSRLEIVKTQIASEKDKPTMPEGDVKRLEDDEIRMNRDIERKLAQMKDLDAEIHGSKPTAELPEGHQGLNDTLEALRELIQVTKKYIKEI